MPVNTPDFRWGIFGTGAVSAKFAADLSRLSGMRIAMVASRDRARAERFAEAFGGQAVADYADAAARAAQLVDAVYIATPPALHREHALACVAAGVPILVEKPLGLDADAARAIAEAARARGVFCMEGMWTRFMPAARRLRDLVRDGVAGEPRMVTGGFGISNAVDPHYGNFDPARGGGALAHLGFYPVSLGQWLFGTPVSVGAIGRLGETGVDEDAALTVRYPGGVVGAFTASLRATAANDFAVLGTHGRLALRGPIYRPWGVRRTRAAPRSAPTAGLGRGARLRESHWLQRAQQIRSAALGDAGGGERHFFAGNGYAYQAAEVAALVRRGETGSEVMPLADSVAVAETLDRARLAIMSGEAS